MNNMKSKVVNSKAGRTTEVITEPRNNISILEAFEVSTSFVLLLFFNIRAFK